MRWFFRAWNECVRWCEWHATERCIRCNTQTAMESLSVTTIYMQSILLLTTGRQSSFFKILSLCVCAAREFLSPFSTLNQSRSISAWQSHLFRNILVFKSIHSAQGISIVVFIGFSVRFFSLISIALAPLFLIKLQIDVNVNAINCYLISSCNSQCYATNCWWSISNETWTHLMFRSSFSRDYNLEFSLIFFWAFG